MTGYGTDEAFATWASENGHPVPDDLAPSVLHQCGSDCIGGMDALQADGGTLPFPGTSPIGAPAIRLAGG